MSSEESETASENEDDEEGAPRRKSLITRKLPWRSDEVEDAFRNLDRKLERRRSPKATAMALSRRFSAARASDRLAPLDAPRWPLRPAS